MGKIHEWKDIVHQKDIKGKRKNTCMERHTTLKHIWKDTLHNSEARTFGTEGPKLWVPADRTNQREGNY